MARRQKASAESCPRSNSKCRLATKSLDQLGRYARQTRVAELTSRTFMKKLSYALISRGTRPARAEGEEKEFLIDSAFGQILVPASGEDSEIGLMHGGRGRCQSLPPPFRRRGLER